jgi:Rrf2 family protein
MSYPLSIWQSILATAYVADKVQLGVFEFVPTGQIAADLGIPAPSLARIMRSLTGSGIIETREGAKGGVRLAIAPEKVSLLAIVDSVDSGRGLFRTDSAVNVSGPIPAKRQTAIREALSGAEERLRASLEEVTIADIAGS